MNNLPITYVPDYWPLPNILFNALWNDLDWERREGTPRLEYYSSTNGAPYTYGRGAGVRTYQSKPMHPEVWAIKVNIEKFVGTKFDVCFINGYKDGSDSLGWHSDNSPEMDDERPIAIVSFGAEREIWFRPMVDVGGHPMVDLAPPAPVEKLRLGHGSLCLMHPGMQDTHQHRIPKAGFECGPRISLTFRGYVEPKN